MAVDEEVNITKPIGAININDYIVVLEGVEHLIFNVLEGNDDGKFAVHEHSGDILLVSALDYEKSSDYMLVVQVTSSADSSKTAIVAVEVLTCICICLI